MTNQPESKPCRFAVAIRAGSEPGRPMAYLRDPEAPCKVYLYSTFQDAKKASAIIKEHSPDLVTRVVLIPPDVPESDL